MEKTALESLVGPSETVIWKGTPDKKCFILESIFNPMLFFAIIWLFLDLFAIAGMINSLVPSPEEDVPSPGITEFLPLILFFSVHLMPVWMYLGGIIGSVISHKAEAYLMTDKAVYFSHGGVGSDFLRLEFTEVEYISFSRGVFDKMLGVGDVSFNRYNMQYYSRKKSQKKNMFVFRDVPDFERVYRSAVDQLQNSKFSGEKNNTDSTYRPMY